MSYPRRKSPRLPSYDYRTQNYYFVTVCTANKALLFGGPIPLNKFGMIAQNAFLQMELHNPHMQEIKSVVMPNHVHALLSLEEETTALPDVIGAYKSHVTKMIHEITPGISVWQRSFHDHVIRNQREFEKIWNYIDTNPVRWTDDCFFE